MLFSAINTSRFLLYNLRSLCPIFFIFALSFRFELYISGRKRGAKGHVGLLFILTSDACIEID